MIPSIRTCLAAATAVAACSLAPVASAQEYPTKPIRLVVPYAAGGGIDYIARNVGLKMSEALGQQIFVDNKPGGSSVIGADAVAHAPADGYTLLIGDTTTFAVNPSLLARLPYDPQKDFAPISLAARFTMMLVVNPDVVNVSTVAQLVDMAKKQPGAITFGSAGQGTPHHLGMELLQQQAGISLNHVPYKGGAPALQDLLAGQIGLMLLDLPTATAHLKNPKLRILATATPEPVPSLKPVPTVTQAGVAGFVSAPTIAIAAPAGTPPAVVARLNAAYAKAVNDPEIRAKMLNMGMEPLQSSPKEMGDFMAAERVKWAAVVKQAKIQVQ